MFSPWTNKKSVLLIALVLGLALAVTVTLYSSRSSSSSTLYDRAVKDRDHGRLVDSIKKLDRLVKKDPGFKDAKRRLATSISAALNQAEYDMAIGNLDDAQEIIDKLKEIDPDNKQINEVAKKIEKEKTKQAKKDTPTGGDDPTSTDPPPNPIDLNDPDTTPLSIVPDDLNDYERKADKWDNFALAGSAYEPKNSDMKNKIGTVLLVVGKLDVDGAKERLEAEKKIFSEEQTELAINDTTAHSGMSAGIMSITWIKGKWFFAVQTIPNRSPSIDELRAVAVDFGTKLGV